MKDVLGITLGATVCFALVLCIAVIRETPTTTTTFSFDGLNALEAEILDLEAQKLDIQEALRKTQEKKTDWQKEAKQVLGIEEPLDNCKDSESKYLRPVNDDIIFYKDPITGELIAR